MADEMSPHQRMQAEGEEIADVLATQQGKSMREVWEEAPSPHRVRFETEIPPPPEEKGGGAGRRRQERRADKTAL